MCPPPRQMHQFDVSEEDFRTLGDELNLAPNRVEPARLEDLDSIPINPNVMRWAGDHKRVPLRVGRRVLGDWAFGSTEVVDDVIASDRDRGSARPERAARESSLLAGLVDV